MAAILSARIADGTYPPRRRVPSEAAICAEFNVSRPTARATLQLLGQRGLIVTVRGKGSFVSEDANLGPAGEGASADWHWTTPRTRHHSASHPGAIERSAPSWSGSAIPASGHFGASPELSRSPRRTLRNARSLLCVFRCCETEATSATERLCPNVSQVCLSSTVAPL
ncbi:GntR family transcriptional regulator [Streptomyces scabiei]|uniref:GntR family transcriptional regulator n=1 Tax=Streptomyces scabiei TaxID=1930 RepID=UPI003697BDD6